MKQGLMVNGQVGECWGFGRLKGGLKRFWDEFIADFTLFVISLLLILVLKVYYLLVCLLLVLSLLSVCWCGGVARRVWRIFICSDIGAFPESLLVKFEQLLTRKFFKLSLELWIVCIGFQQGLNDYLKLFISQWGFELLRRRLLLRLCLFQSYCFRSLTNDSLLTVGKICGLL